MTIPRTRYRCDHVHLRSRDAVAAGAFYVEILGAREIGREGVPVSRVILDIGGLTLFIEQAPDGSLYVVSLTDNAIYRISRRPVAASARIRKGNNS